MAKDAKGRGSEKRGAGGSATPNMTNGKVDWGKVSNNWAAAQSKAAMPIPGHDYHTKSDAELRFIQRDAHEAAQNMRDINPKAEGKYLDQVNDASTVLGYRARGGAQVKPTEGSGSDRYGAGRDRLAAEKAATLQKYSRQSNFNGTPGVRVIGGSSPNPLRKP